MPENAAFYEEFAVLRSTDPAELDAHYAPVTASQAKADALLAKVVSKEL
jgi:hypothetical protein